MSIGDLATWVGAVGTVIGSFITAGVLIVALIQIRNEREIRINNQKHDRESAIRAQAEQISSWVDHEIGNPGDVNNPAYFVIAILNQSANPIYQVIVRLAQFDYHPDSEKDLQWVKNREQPGKYQEPGPFVALISVVPPGKISVNVSSHHGMHFHPAAEIAFKDKANRNWVRLGSGVLIPIDVNPLDYYHIQAPIGWGLPNTEV